MKLRSLWTVSASQNNAQDFPDMVLYYISLIDDRDKRGMNNR